MADDVHSTPTGVRVWADEVDLGVFPTGAPVDGGPRGTLHRVALPVATTASTLRVEVAEVAERLTQDWYSAQPTTMPVSFADIDAGEGFRFAPATGIDPGCRDDLVTIAGHDVPVRVSGDLDDALARRPLTLTGCEQVDTPGGDWPIHTAAGATSGLDLDQLVLESPRPVAAPPTLDDVVVTSQNDTEIDIVIPAAADDRWLVLGQSHNLGWRLSIDGVDQGDPLVIDGFGNGWFVPAGTEQEAELRWTPQDLVDWTLRASALFVVFVVVLAWRGRRDGPHPCIGRIDGPPRPQLGPVPLLEPDRRALLPRRTALSYAVLVTVATVVNLPQWPLLLAIGLGALAYGGLRHPRVGSLAPLLAAGALGGAAMAVMYEQRRYRRPPDFVWPQQFDEVHILGVVAVLLLLVEYVRAAAAPAGAGPADPRRVRPERSPG